MHKHEKINYIELPSKKFQVSKDFFGSVFSWEFVDYGPEYMAFFNAGIDGGFYKSDLVSKSSDGAALVVFYSNDLESTQSKIVVAGGFISKETFSFPGGKRFHFTDPNGNEYAVWSDSDA